MDKKTLKSYRALRAKIIRLDHKIAVNTYQTWDVVKSGPPGGHLVIRGLYNGPRIRELRAERRICFRACRAAEDFVRHIDDPLTRDIFTMRYLDGGQAPTWRDIAQRIGGGNTEDGVKQRACRYLKDVTNVTN